MKNQLQCPVTMHSRRRGFSMAVGLAAGVILLLAVTNLAFYSSHEIGIVKTMLNIKKADFAAFSGMNVVNARLHENRWYQPKRIPNQLQKFKSSHVEKLADYFKDEKTLSTTVFIDEIPHPKAQKGGAENTDGSIWVEVAPKKRQYRALLDHIRVLSLGVSGDEKSLYFGKFIMVPEPYLADDQSVGHHVESPLEGEDLIPIYPEPVWDNKEEEGFTNKERKGVVSVAIAPGQKVKMGEIIMILKFYMADGTKTRKQKKIMTFQYLMVNKQARSAIYANAGGCNPFLVNGKAGKVSELALPAAALGAFKKGDFREMEISFAPGDALVFYSDGIVEARNMAGEEIGYERFKSMLLKLSLIHI